MMASFCINTDCLNDDSSHEDIDWAGMSSDTIVAMTLRRDYLLVLLQHLVDSKTTESAEMAIQQLNESISSEEVTYLKFLDRAGALLVIQEVLTRDDPNTRPRSPAVAAPLLYKFAKHNIGYRRTSNGQLVACEEKQKGYWHLLKKAAGY